MPQCQFPVLCCFLCFRKVTQEIFSELDETKAEPPIFTEDETEGAQRLATPQGGAAQPLAAPTHGEVAWPTS
jgi:hypothetical protein